MWPQLDCKGRAVLLARRGYELGLSTRLCIGLKPEGDTAHAWVEVWNEETWWAADGLSETAASLEHYLTESGLIVLHRHDIPQDRNERLPLHPNGTLLV